MVCFGCNVALYIDAFYLRVLIGGKGRFTISANH